MELFHKFDRIPAKEKIIIMRKLFIYAICLTLSAGFFASCEKQYMGPVDELGRPLDQKGGEDENSSVNEGGGGITDGGYGSDYDNSSKENKKNNRPS